MEATLERGRRLGRKYTLVGFVTLAGGFVLWTSQQIIFAALGIGATPLPVAAPSAVAQGSCQSELRGMHAAVERALVASANARDEAGASDEFSTALAPEWNGLAPVQAECARVDNGEDALAAVLRFRGAGEELARRRARELDALRRDLAVYLPPDGLAR